MRKRKGKGNHKVLKRVLITFGVILVIFVGVIGYFVYDMFREEEILKQEVISWSNKNLLKDDYQITIKTKGDYAYVENAVKNFYKKLSNNVKKLYYYLDSDELSNILSVQNLEADRPHFVKSNQIVSTVKKNVTDSLNEIASLCDEENIKNLLDDEKVDSYYVDFYRQLMYTKQDLESLAKTKKEMEELSNNLNIFLDKVKEMLDFLEKYNDHWFVDNGQLYLDSDALVNEYNGLYKELQTIVNEKLVGSENNFNKNTEDSSV